jgi:hypothetical protein
MNAHVVSYSEFQIIRRASLIELRDARRLARRTGSIRAAGVIAQEIARRLCHAEA